MTKMNFPRMFGQLWIRVTAAVSLVLLVVLGVVVFAVYELTRASERNDLDEILTREGRIIAELIQADTEALLAGSETVGPSESDLRAFASRALALHPGSALHIALVRWGDQTLSSARGPDRLVELRTAGMLPRPTPGRLESSDGFRGRSQVLRFGDSDVFVETMGDDSAIASDARDVAGRTLVAAAIGGLLGLVAIALAVRRSTRPISSVTTAVRQTRLDNLSHRVPEPAGSSEVAVLARDVNTMLDELAVARAARNELIASVSHEIRTPLAAARGHTELLSAGRTTDPSTTIARIDRELVRMTRLVDDLLALARAADPAWLAPRLVSVQALMDELADRVSGIRVATPVIRPAPDVVVEADPDRLLQALTNLVVNAIVHTPEGTAVEVRSEIVDSSIIFVVSDRGPGIPREVLDRFGEAFVRGSESGSGLGLAVSRAVAVAHGGTLAAESDTTGTTVRLSVPVR